MQVSNASVEPANSDSRQFQDLSHEQREFASVFGHLLLEKWNRTLDAQRVASRQVRQADKPR
ncbi:MAG: hypothetical protein KDB05_23705 [Planctomycetales bacterium]|nr:hypothetical protein [Planctomycetales bacterium]